MEYCCHVWAGAPDCSLELLDKLHAASLEPLAHFRNVASLSLFYRFTLVDVLQNWLNCFHFLFLKGGLLAILIDCMIFLSRFLDVARMFMLTVSFLWNSPPIECFLLTYNLNGFKSRINRHFLTVGSF